MTMTHEDWKRQHPMRVMCGGCKATGIKHVWNREGDLVPTAEPCPSCKGTGWSCSSFSEGDGLKGGQGGDNG